MAKEIVIEPAKQADLPSIEHLLIGLIDTVEDIEGFNIKRAVENCRFLIEDPANYVLIAKSNNRVLGLVNFTTRKTIMHARPSGLIDELVVSKGSRGSGIGTRLILAAINKCRELGCCEVEVSTEKSNAEAREFYKSCGFDEDAVLFEINIQD